jgi:hypothetical protein
MTAKVEKEKPNRDEDPCQSSQVKSSDLTQREGEHEVNCEDRQRRMKLNDPDIKLDRPRESGGQTVGKVAISRG